MEPTRPNAPERREAGSLSIDRLPPLRPCAPSHLRGGARPPRRLPGLLLALLGLACSRQKAAAAPSGPRLDRTLSAPEGRFELLAGEQEALLGLARRAVAAAAAGGEPVAPDAELLRRFPRLAATRAAFVTLKEGGELRGCIGSLVAHEPLAADVAQNALFAARYDSRFTPVRPEEVAGIEISISVLDVPRPLPLAGEALLVALAKDHPGVILDVGGRRSTFLPEVWEELPAPAPFLAALCRKQGSPEDCWRRPEARFQSYGAQYFGEERRR